MRPWLIYSLSDPRTSALRYVGVTGSRLEKRIRAHMGKPLRSTKAWILELRALGLVPQVSVLQEVPTKEAAFAIESDWIWRLSAHGLLNVRKSGAYARAAMKEEERR